MVEQQNRKNKKLADILLVYGYDEDETFHQDVVKELQKKDLPNVRYVKYDWKRPNGNMRNVYLAFNKFAKKYLPADHVIDLHDSPNAYNNYGKLDYFWFWYDSLAPRTKDLKVDLKTYQKDLEKLSDRPVTNHFYISPPDYSATYPLYVVELFPTVSTLHEGVMQMEGFIATLQKHPTISKEQQSS